MQPLDKLDDADLHILIGLRGKRDLDETPGKVEVVEGVHAGESFVECVVGEGDVQQEFALLVGAVTFIEHRALDSWNPMLKEHRVQLVHAASR